MYNRYPWWKNLIVIVIFALGTLYAAPNLYHPDAAIQISGESGATEMTQTVIDQAVAALDSANIAVKASEMGKGSVLIRLGNREQQLAGKAAVEKALGTGFVVALNLAPTTPGWLTRIGAKPMKLGLDLAGGVHFLLEVDTSAMLNKKVETYAADLRRELKEADLKNRQWTVRLEGTKIVARFTDVASRDEGLVVIRRDFSALQSELSETADAAIVTLNMTEQAIKELEQYAVDQNVVSLRNRVNELGVAEPLVQKQGANRIVVELPGVQDAAQAKRIIGKTANLEFRLAANAETLSSQRERFAFRNQPAKQFELEEAVIVTGDQVTTAQSTIDPETSLPQVSISLDGKGGEKMNRATRNNIGRQMGVLFIESKSELQKKRNADGSEEMVRIRKVERSLINVATIQSALGVQFRITGLDSMAEASELALLLRAGALVAPVDFVEERTIGPSLGAENIQNGVLAAQLGLILVAVVMVVFYRTFGLFANVAMFFNLLLVIAVMSAINATLTLPGIAAIVLTMGMAVDANVLINGRIKEEIRNGLLPHVAISAGYDRAFLTIFDSNLTTIITALVLLGVGSGPVRGFAIALTIGLLTSMFASVMGSRALVNAVYGGRPLQKISI
jgi:preprotein translocase subunit SecD